MENHSANKKDQPYELFATIPWDQYLTEDAPHGDQITLQAIAHFYNVNIRVVSTLGLQGSVDINEENGIQTFYLGQMLYMSSAKYKLR